MNGIIDRFEGNKAIIELEDKTKLELNRDKLPFRVKEGDSLIIFEDRIELDKEATKTRKKYIEELTKDLWE